ncbi:MAG: 50S ribosomal protein L35 [SAR324 cluster bacterium]|nr:50S ribosomal protein L35 [SAR324 cluster bacterium]
MAKDKMKTSRGAAKRFRIKSSGKIKRKRAYLRHGMRKKAAKVKRRLSEKTYVCGADVQAVKALLPNG